VSECVCVSFDQPTVQGVNHEGGGVKTAGQGRDARESRWGTKEGGQGNSERGGMDTDMSDEVGERL